jgi:hypothetical protein
MAETYTGEVRDGVVVFDGTPPAWPSGTRVKIEPVENPKPDTDRMAKTRRMLLAWAERAEEIAPELPSDLAENHDHYAHGTPRQ